MDNNRILMKAAEMFNLSPDMIERIWDIETLSEDEAYEEYGDELYDIEAEAEKLPLDWYKQAKQALMKKIQITEGDIRKMTKMVINEMFGDDEIPLCDVLYNVNTKQWYLCPSGYGLNWKERWNKTLAVAARLGDGDVFSISFSVVNTEYNDTSFGYSIGMDSGVHHEGYDVPTEVKYKDNEYIGKFQGGRQLDDDEEIQLTPEDIKYIESEVNENPEELMEY